MVAQLLIRAAPRGLFALLAGVSVLAGDPPAALAQDLGDRSEVERKKAEREAAEKARLAAEVKETEEQREARERIENRERRVKEARDKFAQAAQAAAKRQNDRGLELMEAAWMLDPTNLDYPTNTALFAKALKRPEIEFRAHAAVKALAKRALASMEAAAPKRGYYEEQLAEANLRLEVLRATLSTGVLQVSVDPAMCEIYVEGAFLGTGSGEIETITGQRKITTSCQGYTDFELFANVRQGDPTVAKVKPTAIPYFGKLVFRVEPADEVTVFLDDVPIGQRGGDKPTKDGQITGAGTKEAPITLAARKWIIRFHKEGYDRWHRRIDIRRDQTFQVDARLESLAELEQDRGSAKAPDKPGDKPAPKPDDKPAGKPAPAPK